MSAAPKGTLHRMGAIRIALSKGRILEETMPLLAHLGLRPKEDPERSRKLILATERRGVQLVIVRAADVPTYVGNGAAEIGIAGGDVVLEHGGAGLYQPIDLGIARCRLMVATRRGFDYRGAVQQGARLRIATKYVNVTRRYFAEQGKQVEIIKLYGSMELAPIVKLADLIVDLVDTGSTLRANGLEPLEHIADISSRLIVNKAAMKMKHARVKAFMQRMTEAVEGQRQH